MPAISMAVCIIPNFEQKSTRKLATEKVETVLNFEFLVLSCGVRRWRMADFIIVFMAHNTLSKGELRL
jgi:hypothetical protein